MAAEYTLLIVDDEPAMLSSLTTLVSWADLGFRVVATLGDGAKAIDFLKSGSVDVVLTDIRMTFVSGLDVARYVHEQGLATKVVLISGFKDFDDARQAIRYRVAKFLSKPTSLKEMGSTFRELRSELDEERRRRQAEMDAGARERALASSIFDAFLSDLLLGALRTPEAICRRFALLEPGLAADATAVVIARWRSPDRGSVEQLRACLCGQDRDPAVPSLPRIEEIGARVSLRWAGERDLLIYAMDRSGRSLGEFAHDLEVRLEEVRSALEAFLGLRLEPERLGAYPSILALVDASQHARRVPSSLRARPAPTDADRQELRERRKLLVSYVEQCDVEAAHDVLAAMVDRALAFGIELARDTTIELVSVLKLRLEDNGIASDGIFEAPALPGGNASSSYERIIECETAEGVLRMSRSLVDGVLERMREHRRRIEKDAVKRTLDYIDANYANDISLESAADNAYLSPVYLSRLFKERTGDGFVEHLTRVRISRAEELLRDPAHRVYEIADLVGYRNVRYFYRLFKQRTGFTPSEYRARAGLADE